MILANPGQTVIGIRGSSFRDLIPSLRLRRRKRIRAVRLENFELRSGTNPRYDLDPA